MTNEAYIELHRDDKVEALALAATPAGVDLRFCLRQIEGRQIARRKLPSWAETEGLLYPSKVSLEQCSSQQAATYKRQLAERLLPTHRMRMVDLTGGFGIDFASIAPLFDEADYVESNGLLCELAAHNFPLLGLPRVRIHNTTGESFCEGMGDFSLIYLDPSRRDATGRKVVALADCTPDVEALHDILLRHAPTVMVKLSPMLDIHDTLRRLPNVSEVHVVSVGGECKEILLVLRREATPPVFHCVNISHTTETFCATPPLCEPVIATGPGRFLYEPNASILKAGVQDELCRAYGAEKLHPFSHLFVSDDFIADFPGRSFVIEAYSGFGKKELRALLSGVNQCNLTVRNFPASVAELRKRLKLREGGDTFFFATTLSDGAHALLRCKPSPSR